MIALSATNLVGVVLFSSLYAAAGARLISQRLFVPGLLVMFTLVIVLWVRAEARHRALEPVQRVGRAAAGLVSVVIGIPVLVLLPLFWLESRLPPEADVTRFLAPAMTLVFISLFLTVLVNIAGGLTIIGRSLAGRRRG